MRRFRLVRAERLPSESIRLLSFAPILRMRDASLWGCSAYLSMSVRIILETILGILLLAGVGAVIIAFAFKEQWRRLIKYIQLWQADDSRREAIQRRLDNEMRERLANEELQASLAREKAEAEIEKTL